MKGSVFVLLGCFALFFAAPSHSYSISEDDQLAGRRDQQSGSPLDGDSSHGDAQAEKSKIRKRDTLGLVDDYDEPEDIITGLPPIDKEFALHLFRGLGKYGGQCLEQAFDYIDAHEMPTGFVEAWYAEALLTRTDMVKWLNIIKDSVSECLTNYVDDLIKQDLWRDENTPLPDPSQTFDNVPELLSPLTDIAKTLKKCLEDAIRYLEATAHDGGGTVQRSSESFSDLLTELIQTLSLIDGGVVPAVDTVPVSSPGHKVPPYPDSVPVIAYKKRNSLDKPKRFGHYTTLPGSIQTQYINPKDISDSTVPKSSGFREEAGQLLNLPPVYVGPKPTQQFSLLDIVLDKIYSKLRKEVSPAVNMKAAPVEGLRVDANGALGSYPGNGRSPAAGNPAFYPECVNKKVQRRTADGG